MPALAIKRAFTAVSLAWYEFGKSEGIYKFSNLGTMLQDHIHVLIRRMTKSVDTIKNTINCIIRSNTRLEIHERYGSIVSGRMRYSVGWRHYKKSHMPNILRKKKKKKQILRKS